MTGLKGGFTSAIIEQESFPDIGDTNSSPSIVSVDSEDVDGGIAVSENWGDIPDDIFEMIENRLIFQAPFVPKNWRLYYYKYINKIVIPWKRDGEVKCFQYQRIDPNEDCPKYMFGRDQEKDVFNIDRLDMDSEFVYLVEGVYDTIFVKNGVAIGGLNPSEFQLDLISQVSLGDLVYLPDNQHQDTASKRFTLKLIDKGKLVFIWPKSITQKDVNEYVMETGKKNFEDSVWLKSRIFKGIRAKMELGF